MSLREQLAAMLTLRPERYRSLLRELAERLKKTAEEGVLKPGDPMPDFVLPDATGELVFSDDLLKRAPLVVVFFRGDWCPFCRTTLSALNEVAPDIEAAGASLVALTPDTGDYVNAASSGLGLSFPVVSDVDGATRRIFCRWSRRSLPTVRVFCASPMRAGTLRIGSSRRRSSRRSGRWQTKFGRPTI